MLKLDELSGEVAGLEALRANLDVLDRMRKLEDETDAWVRLQQLAELLEEPACCNALQAAVRTSVNGLVDELRKSFTDDVAAAAKDLGWPKVVDIPSSMLHSTDGMIAEWIRPQASGDTPGCIDTSTHTPKKQSHQQRLEHFCRVLARLTTLQLVALKSQPPQGEATIISEGSSSGQPHGAGEAQGGAMHPLRLLRVKRQVQVRQCPCSLANTSLASRQVPTNCSVSSPPVRWGAEGVGEGPQPRLKQRHVYP